MWIGFKGLKCETYLKYANLTANNPIFKYDKDNLLKKYILDILSLNIMTHSNELKIEGLLYFFFSELAELNKASNNINNQTASDIYINKSNCIRYLYK